MNESALKVATVGWLGFFLENLTIYRPLESYCTTDRVILKHKPKESHAFK